MYDILLIYFIDLLVILYMYIFIYILYGLFYILDGFMFRSRLILVMIGFFIFLGICI